MSKTRIALLALSVVLIVGHFFARSQVTRLKAEAAADAEDPAAGLQMAENYGRLNNIALLGGIALAIYAGLGVSVPKRR